MSYATEIGEAGGLLKVALASLRATALDPKRAWKIAKGREFHTLDVTEEFAPTLSIALECAVTRALFLRLPPGASVHRHADVGDVETLHLPVLSNPGALSYWLGRDGQEYSAHLAVGKIYRLDRTLTHWATNHGETDRVHLLVELARP